jgi:hypothetical protein
MRLLKRTPIHPFLMTAFPILALLAHNISQLRLEDALRSLIVGLLGCALALAISHLYTRNRSIAAVITSLLMLLFFSYGHVHDAFETIRLFGEPLGRHRYLAPLWALLFFSAVGLLRWRAGASARWTEALNVIGLVAVALPLIQIANHQVLVFASTQAAASRSAEAEGLSVGARGSQQDVYYIILDGYARADALDAYYLYDNSEFLEGLTERGFYIAPRSQSNYSQTALSLASSLNMDYIPSLVKPFEPGRKDTSELTALVQQSRVRRLFETLGYQTVAFETGVPLTEWGDADFYYLSKHQFAQAHPILSSLNGFESILLHTSAGLILMDAAEVMPAMLEVGIEAPYKAHRERILSILGELGNLPSIEQPKFVFAHVLIPHGPMIFGPNGEFMPPDEPFTLAGDKEALEAFKYRERIQGYRHQVTYVNKRILEIVDALLSQSDPAPVIILQGDHGGPTSGVPDEARLAILNAYHLPGGGSERLYPSISPVNTFRLVFNIYFNGSYELLEDVAYFSEYDTPFNIEIIPNRRFQRGEE